MVKRGEDGLVPSKTISNSVRGGDEVDGDDGPAASIPNAPTMESSPDVRYARAGGVLPHEEACDGAIRMGGRRRILPSGRNQRNVQSSVVGSPEGRQPRYRGWFGVSQITGASPMWGRPYDAVFRTQGTSSGRW